MRGRRLVHEINQSEHQSILLEEGADIISLFAIRVQRIPYYYTIHVAKWLLLVPLHNCAVRAPLNSLVPLFSCERELGPPFEAAIMGAQLASQNEI